MIIDRFKAISDNKEFIYIYQNAKKWHCDCAVIYFLESDVTKFASVASKKIGKAVVRNRVKRLLRAIFYGFSTELRDGIYIVVAKSGLEQIPYNKIQKSLRWSFKKIGSIK